MNNFYVVQQFIIIEFFYLILFYRLKFLGVRNQRKEEIRFYLFLVYIWYIIYYKNGLNWCNIMLGCKFCVGGVRVFFIFVVFQRLVLRQFLGFICKLNEYFLFIRVFRLFGLCLVVEYRKSQILFFFLRGFQLVKFF